MEVQPLSDHARVMLKILQIAMVRGQLEAQFTPDVIDTIMCGLDLSKEEVKDVSLGLKAMKSR